MINEGDIPVVWMNAFRQLHILDGCTFGPEPT